MKYEELTESVKLLRKNGFDVVKPIQNNTIEEIELYTYDIHLIIEALENWIEVQEEKIKLLDEQDPTSINENNRALLQRNVNNCKQIYEKIKHINGEKKYFKGRINISGCDSSIPSSDGFYLLKYS